MHHNSPYAKNVLYFLIIALSEVAIYETCLAICSREDQNKKHSVECTFITIATLTHPFNDR